jgi:hypothetical protein
MADVFISYARENQDFVLKIHKALEARNKDTWIDWKDIPLTAKWLDEVFSGIERGDAFAFVISPGLTIAWGISRWSQFIDAAADFLADELDETIAAIAPKEEPVEPRESAVSVPESHARGDDVPQDPAADEIRRPWWRRWFGA